MSRRPINLVDNTCDHRQLVTLIVHLCLQNDAREAARRAGPSATAVTSYLRRCQCKIKMRATDAATSGPFKKQAHGREEETCSLFWL